MKILFLGWITGGLALAGEYAVLANGFRIPAERHEIAGDRVILHSKDGGIIEVRSLLIDHFEVAENGPAEPATRAPERKLAPAQRDLIDAAAIKTGLPPELVHSVVSAESADRADAVSPKGAIGLMQLMPATARQYGANPRDPEQNVEAGAAYLRDLLIKYDGDPHRALAAYNAGPGAVDRYRGVPPYAETQTYVNRVLRKYKKAIDSAPPPF